METEAGANLIGMLCVPSVPNANLVSASEKPGAVTRTE